MPILAVSDYVRYLFFPLVVLLAGAVVTGLLIPGLTRRRDNERKALEIKTNLVGDISEAVMQFMVAIQFAVLRAASQTQKEYDDAYRAWETKRAVLGTMLEAYFPTAGIGDDWDKFEDNVRRFYALSGVSEPAERKRLATELLTKYGLTWPQHPGSNATGAQSEWTEAWEQLRLAVFREKRFILEKVLNSRIDGLEEASMMRRTADQLRKLCLRGWSLLTKRGSSRDRGTRVDGGVAVVPSSASIEVREPVEQALDDSRVRGSG
jgi:hypothetical protein